MKKNKRRSIYSFLAAFLILFTFVFGSFSASAASVYSNVEITDSINGVPYTFELVYNPGGNLDTMLFSYSPIFYDRGTNPNGYENFVTDRSCWGASHQTIGCFLETYYDTLNAVNNYDLPINFQNFSYDSSGNFRGSVSVFNYLEFEKSADLNISSGTLKLKAQDFSCWTDIEGNTGTELLFDFNAINYPNNVFSFGDLKINYSVYGQGSTVYTVTLSDYMQSNCIFVTPQMLGYEYEDVYIYIHDLEFEINAAPGLGYLFTGSYPLRFSTVYTFNPDLFDYSVGSGGSPGSVNPALPLLGYTEWIGNAVSGVLDLELFPNFTLGGILMTLLAFVCVVWFLKLVAGG